mmetsp:Transcript_21033/g.66639  ORF Transcript_21033/g.66639 Transcript_21033/m.66639 type:complete len:220 (-) Transcript_21033:670-1329(-)
MTLVSRLPVTTVRPPGATATHVTTSRCCLTLCTTPPPVAAAWQRREWSQCPADSTTAPPATTPKSCCPVTSVSPRRGAPSWTCAASTISMATWPGCGGGSPPASAGPAACRHLCTCSDMSLPTTSTRPSLRRSTRATGLGGAGGSPPGGGGGRGAGARRSSPGADRSERGTAGAGCRGGWRRANSWEGVWPKWMIWAWIDARSSSSSIASRSTAPSYVR